MILVSAFSLFLAGYGDTAGWRVDSWYVSIEVWVLSGLVDMQRVGLVPRCTSVRVLATYERTRCITWMSTALSTVAGSWCGLAGRSRDDNTDNSDQGPIGRLAVSASSQFAPRQGQHCLVLGRFNMFPSVEEPGGGTTSIGTQGLLGFANWCDYPLFPVAAPL
jgi:hypothetical protein